MNGRIRTDVDGVTTRRLSRPATFTMRSMELRPGVAPGSADYETAASLTMLPERLESQVGLAPTKRVPRRQIKSLRPLLLGSLALNVWYRVTESHRRLQLVRLGPSY